MRINSIKTKALALILTLAMIVPMLAQSMAFAVEGEASVATDYSSYIGAKVVEIYGSKQDPTVFQLYDKPNGTATGITVTASGTDAEGNYYENENLAKIYDFVVKEVQKDANGGLWFYIYASLMFTDSGTTYESVVEGWVTADTVKLGDKEEDSTIDVTLNGKPVSELKLPKYEKITVKASSTDEGISSCQWQICYDTENDLWVDIYGQNKPALTLSYGLVATLLDENGAAKVRCKSSTAVSDPMKVIVSNSNTSESSAASSAPSKTASYASAASAADIAIYNVTINYVFENGETAANSYTTTVGSNAVLNSTIVYPEVLGYLPYRADVQENSYTFNLVGSEMTGDVVLTVVYKPTLVDYKVVVLQQNIYDDNYTEVGTVTLQGLTGDTTADIPLTYDGFYQLLHEEAEIAADGSTVVEVRFDRYYYLMSFNLGDGGYGVLPVYARYGTEVKVEEDPVRPGYTYEHWTDAAGNIVTFPMTMPKHDITITAVWTPNNAKYTIVYWKENADPNADGTYGYSYWGSQINTTLAGTVVSGSDNIPASVTNNEKQYFTYNDTLTDKNVVVKGDGSTVVNVYYTRNYYTIYFRGYGKCCLTAHTHGTGCNTQLICSLEAHTHGDECIRTLACDIPDHAAHTADCLTCGKTEHAHTDACCTLTHVHTTNCYNNVTNGNVSNNDLQGAPTDPVDGQIYRRDVGYNRIIYINGTWYRYNAYAGSGTIVQPNNNCPGEHEHNEGNCNCTIELHTHIASCYKDVIHTHIESCYHYSCGKVTHTHTDDCYSDCTLPAHTHTNNCNNNNTNNIVHVIVAKYEADISAQWPTYDKLADEGYHYKDANGNVENDDNQRFRGWDIDGVNNEAVSKRINMTPDLCDYNDGVKYADAQYGATYSYRLYYMFESFDQTSAANGTTRIRYNGKYYDSDPAYYQELMYSSNTTFNQKEILGMDPVGTQTGGSANSVIINWLYYDRNRVTLTYQSIDTIVDTKNNIMFGESLKNYQYTGTPPYPSTLEEGAYEFGGWYTTAGCFDGTEVNFDTATMPNGDYTLYAKWEPVTHTVEFYKQKDDSGNYVSKIGDTYEVKHGQILNELYIPEAPEDFENGAYTFNGWYYMDGTTEKRFDFGNLPVTTDLVVYAKWTSNALIKYEISFVLEDGTVIADPITGSAPAGTTKTFDAKGGNDLYTQYQVGYFPNIDSHSITLDIEAENGIMYFEFVYTKVDSVPYSVYYVTEQQNEAGTLTSVVLDGKTYYIVHEIKTVENNRYAVVTENFEVVNGYVPDAFQKSLAVVPGAENKIVFIYTVDTEHAYYKVSHYIQNPDGETWTEYYSYQTLGTLGDTITENPMTITGFTYDPTRSMTSGTVTANGLELKLYYVRNMYPYKVVYKEQSTGNVLWTSEITSEYYGKVVAHTAPDTYGNYTRVSDEKLSITIRIEADPNDPTLNVITCFYEETKVTINYVVVGPNGSGTVNPGSESVKVSTGVATGSTATASGSVYKFVGWYSDEACTNPVPADWVVNGKIIPTKEDGTLWTTATYYAKFEYNLTSLTIEKNGWNSADSNQTFIFNIKGDGVDLDVTVHGNGSTTIDGLTVGATYTVTEKTDWSWRYTPSDWEQSITLEPSDNKLTFTNTRNDVKWLDGNAWADNLFNK